MTDIDQPEGLDTAGTDLWESVTGEYDLLPHELRLLEDACREADLISLMDRAWNEHGRPMISRGSMGQEVAHPLLGEIRQHRTTLRLLLASLRLPDPAEEQTAPLIPMTRSQAATKAAGVRWGAR